MPGTTSETPLKTAQEKIAPVEAPAKKASAKKAGAKKAGAKKAGAKKAGAKKAGAKKAGAKKAGAKKAAVKAVAAKPAMSTTGKPAPERPAPGAAASTSASTAVRKTPAKKASAKKAAAKRQQARKAARAHAAGAGTEASKVTPQTVASAQTPATGETRGEAGVHPEQPVIEPEVTAETAAALVVRADEDPWTTEELAALRDELEAERGRYAAEIHSAEQELADLLRNGGDGAGNDQADVGATSLERDSEMSLANNTREMLFQVERALTRIADGSYGVCESCGQPIGKLRLMAFPRATLCMECKRREERR